MIFDRFIWNVVYSKDFCEVMISYDFFWFLKIKIELIIEIIGNFCDYVKKILMVMVFGLLVFFK